MSILASLLSGPSQSTTLAAKASLVRLDSDSGPTQRWQQPDKARPQPARLPVPSVIPAITGFKQLRARTSEQVLQTAAPWVCFGRRLLPMPTRVKDESSAAAALVGSLIQVISYMCSSAIGRVPGRACRARDSWQQQQQCAALPIRACQKRISRSFSQREHIFMMARRAQSDMHVTSALVLEVGNLSLFFFYGVLYFMSGVGSQQPRSWNKSLYS